MVGLIDRRYLAMYGFRPMNVGMLFSVLCWSQWSTLVD